MNEIAIIGLGEIGTSFGLALKYQKTDLHRVGYDSHKYAQDNALNTDAIDRIGRGIIDAVKNADIIILALPADQVEDVLKLIGQDLKKDAVVLDTSPIKSAAIQWAKQYLKQPSHFIGIYPTVKVDYLSELSNEYHTAHEDLFKDASMMIAPGENTDPSVVKLASDLGSLVGAHSMFIDPLELNGLLSGINNLPWLLVSSLMSTMLSQNSWIESKKLGGKEFAQMTALMTETRTRKEFAKVMTENRENSLLILNEFILHLKEYRDAIQNRDFTSLESLYDKASKGREKWLEEYSANAWRKEKEDNMQFPSMGDQMGQAFLGGFLRKKKNP